MTSVRRSPPTQRVVSLLEHFVAHEGGRYGLSELARELDMSKPTCLGILTTLVDSGHLVCDPVTKTYALGPAWIGIGRLAQQNFTAGNLAAPLLEQLSAQYEAACTASAVIGDEIVILASTHAPGRRPAVPVGQRYPFAPPVGLMYVLWSSDEAFEAWLAKPPTLPVELDGPHLRAVVAECRERGYLVEGLTETGRRLHSLMAGVAAYDLPQEVRELVGEMVTSLGERVYLGADLTGNSGRGRHPVSVLAAPTYDADGIQELVLTLYVGHAITGAEIARRGAALVAVADEVTAAAGGRKART
ncbi:MAG TPA: helix-turn-helix domain-containing protein [Jatrophihabitantaceae bacterium]|nr:helix-turn-helix domain-containing protein [Jatrophihabitantaceae bacterium]